VKYFLADHLGSTSALAKSDGTVTSQTAYDSFGNATNANFPTRYQYTGREYDNFTGLHYYRARFYDANLGRFISEDPIGFDGGDVNLFGYVHNNSINRTDPLGLFDTSNFEAVRQAAAQVARSGPGTGVAAAGAGALAFAGAKFAVVAGAGLAVGYAIGYYPGQWSARYFYPDQFPDTQTQTMPQAATPRPTCGAGPKPFHHTPRRSLFQCHPIRVTMTTTGKTHVVD